MTRNAGLLLLGAVALLPGCPGEVREGVPGRGSRRHRWEKYDSLEAAGRASAPAPRAWDVPENVKRRRWKYIVIHHSATEEGSAESFDVYHREVRGWKGLAYHFVIGNGTYTPDGAVEVGDRWKRQKPGAHAGTREYNSYGIGICLVGDFEHALPTKKQMAKLRQLLDLLTKRFGMGPDDIVRHCDVNETKCPGKNFPWPVGVPADPSR